MEQVTKQKKVLVSVDFEGYTLVGRPECLRCLGLLGEKEVGVLPGSYLDSAWILVDIQPEEPVVMVENIADIVPVMGLLAKRFTDKNVCLEMGERGARTLLRKEQDHLTIVAIKRHRPEVTLYHFKSDEKHYALLAGEAGLSEDRLHDLFLSGEEDWKQYFDSKWYPAGVGDTAQDAWVELARKVQSVPAKDIDMYISVLTAHGHFIYDNFGFPLDENMHEAYAKAVDPLQGVRQDESEFLVQGSLEGKTVYSQERNLRHFGIPVTSREQPADIFARQYLHLSHMSYQPTQFYVHDPKDLNEVAAGLSALHNTFAVAIKEGDEIKDFWKNGVRVPPRKK